MASSTSGSPPAGFNAPLPQQPEDEKNPVTVYVSSEEAVNKNKGRKYSILRRLLAFIFGWLITAAFVVLPGSLNNLEQSHPQKVEGVLRSVQNVPLLLISGLFCLVGIVGICVVSWKYAHDHDWLFHEFYRPVASGGLFGVLSTIADIYTAHDGKYSASNIATLAVMGSIAIVFGLLAVNSYRHIQRNEGDPRTV